MEGAKNKKKWSIGEGSWILENRKGACRKDKKYKMEGRGKW
jgi:hypothetical protein